MPPSLLTLALRALRSEARCAPDSIVMVAVSGGPDSMALLHVLARLAPKLAIAVHAHGIDHGLRAEAPAELDAAAAFARDLGVPFDRTRVHLAEGGNLQARARRARYAALADAARAAGATSIATAHHADDRAETVLIRLLRGAGPAGLAVLPPRAPLGDTGIELLRPFVRAPRAAVVAHVERHHVPFASDPSNDNPRYLRTRVRHELMPLLRELSPGIVDHLVALADQLAPERTTSASSFPLPRSTQVALAALQCSRSPTARVWLPGGLVATIDPQAHAGPHDAGRPSEK